MAKKITIGVIAVLIIIAIIFAISSYKPGSKESKTDEPGQQGEEVSKSELDKSMDSTIESLKSTCTDFLKGDLSGDPKNDCPGFDQSINVSLCYYCYATRDQIPSLCGQINNDVALRSLCQKATGVPVDNLDK